MHNIVAHHDVGPHTIQKLPYGDHARRGIRERDQDVHRLRINARTVNLVGGRCDEYCAEQKSLFPLLLALGPLRVVAHGFISIHAQPSASWLFGELFATEFAPRTWRDTSEA